MKRFDFLKPWLLAVFLGIFVTACATTQEEVLEDGPPPEDQTQMDGDMATEDDLIGVRRGPDSCAEAELGGLAKGGQESENRQQ